MINNIKLFEECLKHDEKILDDFYSSYKLLDEDIKKIDYYYTISSEIKEKLITIKQIIQNNRDDNIVDKFIIDILELLLSKDSWWKYNEFWCFIHACDLTIDGIKKIKTSWIENIKKVLKDIITCYINERSIYDIVIKEWIIALYDDWASRRQWKSWENKIKQILERKWYIFVEDWDSFFSNSYSIVFISSNKWIFSANNIKENLNIDYNFNNDKNKSSDVLVKKGDEYYIIEAKHLKEWWGNQDKQFQELVNLIFYTESSKKVHYVWFLDWIYWNFLLKSDSEYKDIWKNRIELVLEKLSKNSNNYFINTYWLESLF